MFQQNVFNFGTVSRTDVVKFEFPLKEGVNPDDLHYIAVGCGCTRAEFDPEKNAIVGELTISAAAVNFPTNLSKTINILLDPHIPEYTADSRKKKISNLDKRRITLQVVGHAE
jgi:hypothetical protein